MKHHTIGHAHARHLLAEHRRLDQLLHRTVATLPSFEEGDAAGWMPCTIAGLKDIRQELARHFQEEEAGACLEEAVAHRPSLASEAARLLAEHPALRAGLNQLIARFESAPEPSSGEQPALAQELRALVRQLRQHEALENRLIERAFAVEFASEDPADDPTGN